VVTLQQVPLEVSGADGPLGNRAGCQVALKVDVAELVNRGPTRRRDAVVSWKMAGQVGHVLIGGGPVEAGLSGCLGAQACGTASQSDSSGQRDHHGDQETAEEFLGTEAAGESEQCGSRGDHQ
jgi:hypothetical protein